MLLMNWRFYQGFHNEWRWYQLNSEGDIIGASISGSQSWLVA
jgi:hypothetical protein